MLFNSYEFIFIFLPITLLIYFYLNHKKLTIASKIFLISSSLFFYSWWNIIYLPLILSSIVVNFFIGLKISQYAIPFKEKINRPHRTHKKIFLIIGILFNILLIGYFKYSDFFIENFNIATSLDVGLLNLTLPLAISFFTFQQISYLVDSYKSNIKEYSFINYALFVTFFPQLIAGPIVHHREMMPQFENIKNKIINYRNIALGLFIFSIGLFKKVAIADTFAIWANNGFDSGSVLNFFEAWATSLSYTFQLYFDFSGYSDMAIGLALFFNIKLPINFNSPYKATNIQDFWKRWHMTLSRFLKYYVYIPLGGNRKSSLRTYINLIATFIIGGIWHGAGWTFVFWGFLHGMALVVHKLWSKLGFKLWALLAWFITFNFVNIAWVFFRAKKWDDAINILDSMFSLDNIVFTLNYLEVAILFCAFIIVLLFKNSVNFFKNKFQFSIKQMFIFIVLMTISILLIKLGNSSDFLYFNF